ncbi:MAG: HD domain-containing protein [Parcubacteria group bacterium]|nr:HD domain-containing protein [Parcubacteria group bacterium]
MKIPKEILEIIDKLQKANFEAYLVGGCVRDLLLKKQPKDWDITTNARPEEIQKMFPESVYENEFATVLVKTNSKLSALKTIEITTFRQEGKYTDKRHPDTIKFAQTLEEDLSRRDFTINAMAMEVGIRNQESKVKEKNTSIIHDSKFIIPRIIDPFNGQEDLKEKFIRAVGNPQERFQEDALRLMRAIRFACELNFQIATETFKAIQKNAPLLKFIAQERIRDEFTKIIETPRASQGILLLQQTNLLSQFIPELEKTIGVTQNKHHLYTVFEHLWRSLEYASQKNYSLEVRLASLFHDLGKPKTKEGEGTNATFYNHEIVSTQMTRQILTRLKFPTEKINKITLLVRYHGFVYDPEITTDAAIRRLLVKVGSQNIQELAQLREADRIGSGCPKALPFRLRHFLFKVEKIIKQLEGKEPSLKMLKINGNDIMKITKLKPGPKIGFLLNILLEEVLDDPQKNKKDYLKKRTQELNHLSEKELQQMDKKAKIKYQNLLANEENKIKRKYKV